MVFKLHIYSACDAVSNKYLLAGKKKETKTDTVVTGFRTTDFLACTSPQGLYAVDGRGNANCRLTMTFRVTILYA